MMPEIMMTAFFIVLASSALGAPPASSHFMCDLAARSLFWESSGVLLRIDDAGVALIDGPLAKPMSPPKTKPPTTLGVVLGEDTVNFRGQRVERCAPSGCKTAGKLAAPANEALALEDGAVLFSVGGSRAGVYLVRVEPWQEPTLVFGGEVLALCPHVSGASALVRVGADAGWVRVRGAGEASALLSFAGAVVAAVQLGPQPLPALERASKLMSARQEREAEAMAALLATDARLEARVLAAGMLAQSKSELAKATLELLVRDAAPEVRREAFAVMAPGFVALGKNAAISKLVAFLGDPDRELSFSARDRLLELDPKRALAGAPRDYKLDLLTKLMARAQRDGLDAIGEVLSLLASDDEAAVREGVLEIEAALAP